MWLVQYAGVMELRSGLSKLLICCRIVFSLIPQLFLTLEHGWNSTGIIYIHCCSWSASLQQYLIRWFDITQIILILFRIYIQHWIIWVLFVNLTQLLFELISHSILRWKNIPLIRIFKAFLIVSSVKWWLFKRYITWN